MSLPIEQIERHLDEHKHRSRRIMKKWRVRKMRRVKSTEIPRFKYRGWEY